MLQRFYLLLLFFGVSPLSAQVFMPDPEVGAQLGLSGAALAVPSLQFGVQGPAQLGFMQENMVIYAGAALPHGIKDWNVNRIDFAKKIGKTSGFGLSLASQRVPQYSENAVGLQYGRALNAKAAIGISFGAQFVQAAEYGSNVSPLVRVHIQHKLNKTLTVGASVSNPAQLKSGTAITHSHLNLGLSWAASSFFSVNLEASKSLERPLIYRLGMSYSASERIVVLAGVQTSSFAKASMGFGIFAGKNLRIDAAALWHNTLGVTPSLGLRFGR
jgi:hypothetical protein